MKINKEFIPLILSGEKIYEVRKSAWFGGTYLINNELYTLTRVDKCWEFSCDDDINNIDISFSMANIHAIKSNFDIATYNFLKDYHINYLKENIDYYIYRWEKFTPKELEIIDKEGEK